MAGHTSGLRPTSIGKRSTGSTVPHEVVMVSNQNALNAYLCKIGCRLLRDLECILRTIDNSETSDSVQIPGLLDNRCMISIAHVRASIIRVHRQVSAKPDVQPFMANACSLGRSTKQTFLRPTPTLREATYACVLWHGNRSQPSFVLRCACRLCLPYTWVLCRD